MDFKQLQYIIAVAEHQSITKAAASLYVSQPSLSHFISKTEEEMGVKLFDRSTNPITLTYAGEQYIKNGREILFIQKRMKKQFRDISQNLKGRLRVGMPRERAAYMLPLILPEYRKVYPGIEFSLYTASGKALYDSLYRGDSDFIILPSYNLEKGMESFNIYEEELVLVAQKGYIGEQHLLEGTRGTVDLKKLDREPFVVLQKGHAIRDATDLLFTSYRVDPQIVMVTNSNITCCRLASVGVALTIVPRLTLRLAKLPDEVDVFSLSTPPVSWEIHAIYRHESYIGLAEKAFFEIAGQKCNNDMDALTTKL